MKIDLGRLLKAKVSAESSDVAEHWHARLVIEVEPRLPEAQALLERMEAGDTIEVEVETTPFKLPLDKALEEAERGK